MLQVAILSMNTFKLRTSAKVGERLLPQLYCCQHHTVMTLYDTMKIIIEEWEERQQIWLRGEKCKLAYMYKFVCNASGMQLASAHAN